MKKPQTKVNSSFSSYSIGVNVGYILGWNAAVDAIEKTLPKKMKTFLKAKTRN